MQFRVPLPPNIANRTVHWARRRAWKRDYWRLLETLSMLTKKGQRYETYVVPPPPEKPWTHVTITGHIGCFNPMDDDNAMARMKFLLDWLVRSGYLKDDSRKHVTWTGLPTQSIERQQSPFVTLDITPTVANPTEAPTTSRKPRARKQKPQP